MPQKCKHTPVAVREAVAADDTLRLVNASWPAVSDLQAAPHGPMFRFPRTVFD